MADVKASYPAASDVTITLASLASDTNLLAGRESTAVDNSSNLYLDYLISGKITTGTSPTAASIQVWTVGSWDGTTWPDVFDGTSSAETITSADIKNALCKSVAILPTNNTSDRTYSFTGVSMKTVFGGVLPSQYVLFVVHNTGVALNGTAGNHELRYQGVYPQVQ